MPEAPPTVADLALEQAGLEFLRGGKFRKARDAFKSLRKTQPARALPLLIEANLGLANELMSKGQVSEANQVLAYLKTIAPEASRLAPGPSGSQAPGDAWASMVPLAVHRLASNTHADTSVRAADEIILGAESPDHPGHPDAKAILSALEIGYATADTGRTAPLLRSVPRSSPFSHWVFFFKGMSALEAGDRARAADCFRRIPESSLLQASLPALLAVCGASSATPQPAPQTVRALCAWAGHPALAEPLLQAEPLWNKKRRGKAFNLLAAKFPKLFKWGARDYLADLTRHFIRTVARPDRDDPQFLDAVMGHVEVKSRESERVVFDLGFFSVPFSDFRSCAHNHYQAALENLREVQRVLGVSPAMLSRIFTLLAESYIDSVKSDPGDMCSPPNAKKALEQAIAHDPGNLRAWLIQCDLLSMGLDTSAYHRFLDALSKRFPEEKEVLIRNGECCIGRGSYTKALRNFDKAAKIDSVDPRIASGSLRARLGIAEQAYKKKNRTKANWELIESLATTHSPCPEWPLWRIRARRIVLEARNGTSQEDICTLTAASLPLAPSPFRFLVCCLLILSKDQLKFKPGLLEKMFPDKPSPGSLEDFLAIIDELETIAEDDDYLSVSGRAAEIFAEHEGALLDFVVERKHLIRLLLRIFTTRQPNLAFASPVIREWFARDPSDPVLCYLCTRYRFPWLDEPLDEDTESLMEEIQDTEDPESQRLLMLFMKQRHRAMSDIYGPSDPSAKLDLDYDPHGDDEDDDYDEDEDFDEDEDYDEDEEFFADDKSMRRAMAEAERRMAKMSPDELLNALGDMLAGGFPGGAGAPGAASPGKSMPPGKRAQKPTPSDAGQMLFDDQFMPPPNP